jgi:hypothetical protein
MRWKRLRVSSSVLCPMLSALPLPNTLRVVVAILTFSEGSRRVLSAPVDFSATHLGRLRIECTGDSYEPRERDDGKKDNR